VCENDRSIHEFDLPCIHQNTSHCPQETYVSHNEETNTQPDIIPSACTQHKIAGEEVQNTGYSESCSHPYSVNHFVHRHNSVPVNNASCTQEQSRLPKKKELSHPSVYDV
jgi:hypothetical protein